MNEDTINPKDLQEIWAKKPPEPKTCPRCGKQMLYSETGGGQWKCYDCDEVIHKAGSDITQARLQKRIPRYFIHGAVFSVLSTAFSLLWTVGLVLLVAIGYIIGLLIGLAISVFFVGFINSVVSRFVWGFSMKFSLTDTFLHGLVLLLVLLIPGVPMLLLDLNFPGNITVIAAGFIVSCFINGIIGKKIAEFWRE